MKKYSSYWWRTIFAAIIFHLFACVGFAFILPYLMPKPEIEKIIEMNWVDVDLTEDLPIADDDLQTFEIEDEKSEFLSEDFPPLVIPDFPAEDSFVEEIPQQKIESQSQTEQEKNEYRPLQERQPFLSRNEAEVLNQLERNIEDEKISDDKKNAAEHQMSQPPVALKEIYPPKIGLEFKGYVSVLVTIGIDGKIKAMKVIKSSERIIIDNIALNAAKNWIFKPALDQDGNAMESNKIITFDFKNI